MSRAKMRREGLEELVERPLTQQPVTYLHIPSFKIQTMANIGTSGGVGGVIGIENKMSLINSEKVYGDPYMDWLAILLEDPNKDGWPEDDILAVLRGVDHVSVAKDSPTLQQMTQNLKNFFFPREVAFSFAVYKGIIDVGLALGYFIYSLFKRPGEKKYYREIAKANGLQVGIDAIAAGGVYGEIQLQKEIIRKFFLGYTIHGEGTEGALRRIDNYNAYTTGLGGWIGYGLAIAVPILLMISHYLLLRRAYKKADELIKKLRSAIKT